MTRHRFHGDPVRFDVVASFVAERYGRTVKHVADVAGGQGMLTRVLRKKYGYEAEVVDPRGWTLRGVASHETEFDAEATSFFDLIIGLHPDEATRAVAEAAVVRPVVLVPCCNFWDRSQRLGTKPLVEAIGRYYDEAGVSHEVIELDFRGPKNLALVSSPP